MQEKKLNDVMILMQMLAKYINTMMECPLGGLLSTAHGCNLQLFEKRALVLWCVGRQETPTVLKNCVSPPMKTEASRELQSGLSKSSQQMTLIVHSLSEWRKLQWLTEQYLKDRRQNMHLAPTKRMGSPLSKAALVM